MYRVVEIVPFRYATLKSDLLFVLSLRFEIFLFLSLCFLTALSHICALRFLIKKFLTFRSTEKQSGLEKDLEGRQFDDNF